MCRRAEPLRLELDAVRPSLESGEPAGGGAGGEDVSPARGLWMRVTHSMQRGISVGVHLSLGFERLLDGAGHREPVATLWRSADLRPRSPGKARWREVIARLPLYKVLPGGRGRVRAGSMKLQ